MELLLLVTCVICSVRPEIQIANITTEKSGELMFKAIDQDQDKSLNTNNNLHWHIEIVVQDCNNSKETVNIMLDDGDQMKSFIHPS